MNWTIRIGLTTLSLFFILSGVLIKNRSNPGQPEVPGGLIEGQETDVLKTLAPELPPLPDSKIASYQQEKDLIRFTLTSDLKKDEVLDFYRTELLKEDFKKVSENRYYLNGKELEIEVSDSPLDSETIIILNYTLVPTK